MKTKPLPNNPDAERALLGGILMDPAVLPEVRTRVKPETFFNDVNRRVYAGMLSLDDANKPIDLVTLASQLGPELERIGGNAVLMEIANHVPTAAGVNHYADMLAGLATRRETIAALGKAIEAAYDGTDADQILMTASDALLRLTGSPSGRSRHVTMKDAIRAGMGMVMKLKKLGGILGISTGLSELDKLIYGLIPGDVTVIGAGTGMGKTVVGMFIAIAAAKQGKHVAIFNHEMDTGILAIRALAAETSIKMEWFMTAKLTDGDLNVIGSQEVGKPATGACARIGNLPVYLFDSKASDFAVMASECRRLKSQNQLDLIVIDYLQLVHMSGQNFHSREREVATISRSIKMLAKSLGVPVILVSQLSRAPANRLDKRPVKSDLRDSGQIEQDASNICLLYRESEYNQDADPMLLEMIIDKNRNGRKSTIPLTFNAEKMQISERHGGGSTF